MKDYGTEEVLGVPREIMTTLLDESIATEGMTAFWITKHPEVITKFLVEAAGFKKRNDAESDVMFKQLIPYCLIVYSGIDGDLILGYSRGKASGESRLHAKRSIGVGGHINPDDIGDDTWKAAVYRELKEEIGLDPKNIQDFFTLGFVNDEENDVGKVHLGVVHVIVVNTVELPEVEEALVDVEWDTYRGIEMEGNLETWTQFILTRLRPYFERDPWLLSTWDKKDLSRLGAV